ncbi:efflux transporter outer membrane subunit [Methylovulum psychrotolerans]|uniref:Multidrug transporter n=1 Tax=Methylovulum psychrotolerans TaxID=1704499 RepID=A0A2S5CRF5_9GAMM|nr:efflux transporter outer membrane subunit [Methylovulum psychrotolerans]POZ53327.1 multidrug transporter [Methylovulum psychrotolerans]
MKPSFLVCLSMTLSACTAVGPDYKPPTVSTPKQWQGMAAPTAAQAKQADAWWQTFRDPQLNQLINEAITANLDVRKALMRVKDVRAQRVAIYASALPSMTARSNISRRLNNTSSGSSAAGGSSAGGGFGIGNQLIDIFQTGFDAQWELDFFGGVRRAAEAADATVDSEIENSRDILVTLIAEVARNYLELRANQQLLGITQANVTSQADTLALTQIRQQSGLADSLAAVRAEAQLATTQAQLPNYESQIQQKLHALSLLLGKQPAALNGKLQRPAPLPSVAATVIPDLPSELLKRRPDIRRAERLLAVATANIGVAKAELYPKLNLTAFLGLQNMSVKDVTPIGKSWSTAASLTLPIFNWGNLQANVSSKQALSEEAKLSYETAVLTAFKDVEDALIAYSKEQQRHQALARAVAANQLAVQLATERYQKGLTAFTEVLDSQQALYQTQSSQAESNLMVASNLVALYKALGGGWQTPVSTPMCQDCKNSWAESIHQEVKALLYKNQP